MPKCSRCGITSTIPIEWGEYSAVRGIKTDYCPGCNTIFRNMCTQWKVRISILADDWCFGRQSEKNLENSLSLLLCEIQNDAKIHNFDFSVVLSTMSDPLRRLEWGTYNKKGKKYMIG
jgi:hypothetical protein